MKAPLTRFVSRMFESSPLRHARFRLFYLASIGTALGYTMQTTIAAWVMATLTPSQLMVALVQTASTAPHHAAGIIRRSATAVRPRPGGRGRLVSARTR